MRTWAKSGRTVLLTASFVALGVGIVPGTALADTTDGTSSVLGGNQVQAPISAPIDISGNALAIFGTANAASTGGTKVVNGGGVGNNETSGTSSVGGGNQIAAPISAPINACGNAIAIFGTADAGCKGGAQVINDSGSGGGNKTDGKYSVLGGNQLTAPISAPINACGNAIAIFGSSEAGCKGGAEVINGAGQGGDVTSGTGSVGGGNQVYAPVSAPVNVCGNAAAIFGTAVAGCEGGAKVVNQSGKGGMVTNGEHSVLGGNQVNAPASAPVNVCGNAIGNAVAGCKGGAEVENTGKVDPSGKNSVGGGNQVHTPVSVPVNVCGNAAAVLGNAAAFCEGGATVRTSEPGGMYTNGDNSVLGGNQVYAPVTAPINVCGNVVAVVGNAVAGCVGGSHADGSGAPHIKTSGKNSVGGGNQIVAPVKAPIDVCGNAVTVVVGHAVARCGTELVQKHTRLPVVPGLAQGLPVTGALPALSKHGALPMRAPSEPVPGLLAGLPGGDLTGIGGLSGTFPTGQSLREHVPSSALPVTGDLQLPATGGTLEPLQQVTGLTGALPMASSSEPSTVPGTPLVLLAGALMAAASVTGAALRRLVRRR